jgi:hypothetical protein
MDRAASRADVKISSFKSLVGTTWVLSEGYCVLGYYKTRAEARAEYERRISAAADAAGRDPGLGQGEGETDHPRDADPDSQARPAPDSGS